MNKILPPKKNGSDQLLYESQLKAEILALIPNNGTKIINYNNHLWVAFRSKDAYNNPRIYLKKLSNSIASKKITVGVA